MTDFKKDGGLAFPGSRYELSPIHANTDVPAWAKVDHPGLTARDYFAAKAMAAIIAHTADAESIAMRAYRYADAMLAEREK